MQYQFHTLKKIVMLLYLLVSITTLSAQTIDSLAYKEEMQRIQKVSDSLNRLQIAKDSLSLEEIMAIQKTTKNAGEENVSEAEKRFNEMMLRQDKEQHILRNRLLILVAFLLILIFSMRTILNKQRQRKKSIPDK